MEELRDDEKSIADDWDYVMYGKVFKINPPTDKEQKLSVAIHQHQLTLNTLLAENCSSHLEDFCCR